MEWIGPHESEVYRIMPVHMCVNVKEEQEDGGMGKGRVRERK